MPRPPHADRIAEACRIMEADLSAPHGMADLARHCGMSEFHFQRQFVTHCGETAGGYLRARRLERAAHLMRETGARLIDIALECGFDTHSALSRAFRGHFGVTPSAFRREGAAEVFDLSDPRPFLKLRTARQAQLEIEVIDCPLLHLCYRVGRGMKDGHYFPDITRVGTDFRALFAEVRGAAVAFGTAFRRGPEGFDDAEAEGLYGAVFDAPQCLGWSDDWLPIPAGSYAVTPHFGSYETLFLTWGKLARLAPADHGLKPKLGPLYELYTPGVDPADPEQLTALLHMPVEKAGSEQRGA